MSHRVNISSDNRISNMAMSNLKLVVDVVGAHNLLPKDGHGSSSAVVELHFDNQTTCTTVKEKDLNPVWNESFYFNIVDPSNLHNLTLDAYIYNDIKSAHSRSFLGKVSLHGTSFVPHSDSVVLRYPLQKRGVFSRVRGELSLGVYTTDDPSMMSSAPLPALEDIQSHAQSVQNSMPSNSRSEARHTFHHLPNSNYQNQQQNATAGVVPNHVPQYAVDEMKSELIDWMFSGSPEEPVGESLKEISPLLGGGQVVGGRVVRADRIASAYDLVERMQFLYVRVVKARDLPVMDVTGSVDPYVEVRIGNLIGVTKPIENQENPAWNVVFAFLKEEIQSSLLQVAVKDNCLVKNDLVGLVWIEDLNEVPMRVPPDSPLAPQWYQLGNKNGEKINGELMLAVWIGTQADVAFPDAWHLDTSLTNYNSPDAYTVIRSKVYQAPRLWYVRVNVVEAHDLATTEKNRVPDVYVKAQIGNQVMKTKNVHDLSRMFNPMWNEDLLFVAGEPFEDCLVLTVEDHVGPGKHEMLGIAIIPLSSVEKREDDRVIRSHWFNLGKPGTLDTDKLKKDKFYGRLHLRLCLDGAYHVVHEPAHYSSDLRPTAKELWKPPMGVIELGILEAVGLHPMKIRDGKETSDTYCVAKYGHKWVRTRTIVDNLFPKYNEQYNWEVFDPATVLTVGVFDNSLPGHSDDNDSRIGKVQIRISTLEPGHVYTHSYPLLVLHPTGVEKMGELHLAIRFSYTSLVNMLYIYSRPLLPIMHYVMPITAMELVNLHHQAVNIVAARLGRAEPPLRQKVVEYMFDEEESHLWSRRRSKVNFFRLRNAFSGLFAVGKWFGDIRMWKNPITTMFVHVLFSMAVCFPKLILPTVFLHMFLKGIWNFWYRARYPPHTDIKISHVEGAHPDELDEEFDTFPTSVSSDLRVRMRYDRLRIVAGWLETVVGDIATQGERLRSLFSWRDPRLTALSVTFCPVAAAVLYVTPFKAVVGLAGLYAMRHPRFRYQLPSAPVNFFLRLPARTDCML